jgi:hypothetical protein
MSGSVKDETDGRGALWPLNEVCKTTHSFWSGDSNWKVEYLLRYLTDPRKVGRATGDHKTTR